jgi:hypothetical protein
MVAFGLAKDWTAFSLFAAATLLALVQLVRILLRKKLGGGGGAGGGMRRW